MSYSLVLFAVREHLLLQFGSSSPLLLSPVSRESVGLQTSVEAKRISLDVFG